MQIMIDRNACPVYHQTVRQTGAVCLFIDPFYRDIRRHSHRASARDEAAPFCVPDGDFRGLG